MRALFIGLNYAPERTGIAPYTAGMAERMASGGHDVDVITTFPHYPEWRFADGTPPHSSSMTENGVLVTRVRHRMPRPGSSISRVISELSFGVRALFARWATPEAVVLISPALFATMVLVPRLLIQRLPFTIWVQDLYGLGVSETGGGDRLGLVARVISALEGWTLRRADSVVVINERMAQSVLQLGVPFERVSVVRNWSHVDIEPAADSARRVIRDQFGWRDDEVIVLHTGNMGVKQYLCNVVESARIAERRGAAIRFVLVGDGNDRAAVAALAAGVATLQLLPPQPGSIYGQLLQAADVLLVNEHPGLKSMALPSKLTSYFASGRPVLAATAADSATALELHSAGTGVLVEPGEPGDLLDAVLRLAVDAELIEALSRAGLDYRRDVLGADSATAAFEAVVLRAAANETAWPTERTLVGPIAEIAPITAPRGVFVADPMEAPTGR